jgi:hypothetical protein
MARKSRYNQLVAAIDQARKPAPLGPPPPKGGWPEAVTAPVYNANWTKAFEEDITGIHPNGAWKDEWKGTVVNSFGRNGQNVTVWYNRTRQCWEY